MRSSPAESSRGRKSHQHAGSHAASAHRRSGRGAWRRVSASQIPRKTRPAGAGGLKSNLSAAPIPVNAKPFAFTSARGDSPMFRRACMSLVINAAVLISSGGAFAQDPLPKEAQKAADAVKAHLETLKGAHAQLIYKDDAALEKTFPDYQFIVARYRQFPVAKILPKGLSASNVFAVARKDQELLHIKD